MSGKKCGNTAGMLDEIALSISPSRSEKRAEARFASSVVSKIRSACPRGFKVVLAGSVAKGTFLRDSKDLDVFVLVGKQIQKSGMEAMLEAIMRKAYPRLGYQLSYAEHPYLRFHLGGRKIDLVPAYRIKNARERLSAVDRSVLHTKYVRSSLKEGQKRDVLLLKKFLKANSLYGAEIKTEGFPGYLCELLILHYGGFLPLVRAAAKWKPPVAIDIEKLHPKKSAAGFPERFGSGLVVIDPTDPGRNVAAAVSARNLGSFMSLCRRFSRNPSAVFFTREPKSFQQKVSGLRGRITFVITLPKPNVVDEVLWGQLKKLMRQLAAHMRDFGPEEPFADDEGEVRIALPLKTGVLPENIVLEGPPLVMKEHVGKFRKAHAGAKFVKSKGRMRAVKKRSVRRADEALKQFFKKFGKAGSHLSCPPNNVTMEKKS